jgi:hypothetical protein
MPDLESFIISNAKKNKNPSSDEEVIQPKTRQALSL